MEERKTFEDLFELILPKEGLEFVMNSKFFDMPASTRFHLSKQGGLYEHSLTVMNTLVDLTTKLNLVWSRPESPFIVGMFHDMCKYDLYLPNADGSFSYNTMAPSGHGDKSVRIVDKHIIKLTEEERACIRWHMGSFDDKANWSHYTEAIKRFPNVLYTHMADMIASNIIEK